MGAYEHPNLRRELREGEKLSKEDIVAGFKAVRECFPDMEFSEYLDECRKDGHTTFTLSDFPEAINEKSDLQRHVELRQSAGKGGGRL